MSAGNSYLRRLTDVIRQETRTMPTPTRRLHRVSTKRHGVTSTQSEKHASPADALLQPWFLDHKLSYAIKRLIPRKYFYRMRWLFDDYGCLRCNKKRTLYGGNGFCNRCRFEIMRRLRYSLRRRAKKLRDPQPPEPKKWYFDRADAAEKLLADLVGTPRKESSAPRVEARSWWKFRRQG